MVISGKWYCQRKNKFKDSELGTHWVFFQEQIRGHSMCGCRDLTGERFVNGLRTTLDFRYLISLKFK